MNESPWVALRYLFCALVLIGLFFVFPILDSLRLSFFRLILAFPWLGEKFVGLENYRDLFTDPIAFKALLTTLVFVAVTTSLEVTFGLGIALVLNETFRGRGLLRALVLIPWAIPTVVSSQMWRFIFNDQYGVLNAFLPDALKASYGAPLADPELAPIAIMIAEVWKTTSFAALIILAGLQSIPDELYEAGSIDGMSSWQQFRNITLPLVKPALLLALLFRTIDALRVFDLVFVMTQGGPADATNVIQYYGYKKIFAEGMVGYGSAVAVGIFIVSLVLSLLYIRTVGARLLEAEAK
ncbi:MAG TPA: sugar ABC transporter permease [Candidatus Acidoferrales bacterium]|nr:sugar ABC transporter permease [Candidatus Acidoferrales bacterium]